MLTAPTLAELAIFTGRAESYFSAFVTQALVQSTLLFSLRTHLTAYPTDPDLAQLARNAIMEMADRIYLDQPNASIKVSPYQSETIGSYSYSKGASYYKAKAGESTGLFWWDLAMDELSQIERSEIDSASVSCFERELFTDAATGQRYVFSPAEYGVGSPLVSFENLS